MMELLIPLDSRSKKPLYEQIYSHIRAEIRNGALKAGERLPIHAGAGGAFESQPQHNADGL